MANPKRNSRATTPSCQTTSDGDLAYRCPMRFRRNEWDVPMPAALIASWTAWNEADLGLIRSHLDLAVAESIE